MITPSHLWGAWLAVVATLLFVIVALLWTVEMGRTFLTARLAEATIAEKEQGCLFAGCANSRKTRPTGCGKSRCCPNATCVLGQPRANCLALGRPQSSVRGMGRNCLNLVREGRAGKRAVPAEALHDLANSSGTAKQNLSKHAGCRLESSGRRN